MRTLLGLHRIIQVGSVRWKCELVYKMFFTLIKVFFGS